MKIFPINCFYSKLPVFSGKKKEEIRREYNAIKEAIQVIVNDDSYPLALSSISRLTDIPYTIVYNRFHANSDSAAEVTELWLDAYKKRGVEHKKKYLSKAQTQERFAKDYSAIKKAIEEISKNPNLRPTKATIASLTGLNDSRIYVCFNTNFPEAKEITMLWTNVLQERNAYKANMNKVTKAGKFEKIDAKLSAKENRTKNLRKAVKMIDNALETDRKLTYKDFEVVCGLNKDEVDEIIRQYAEFKQKQSRLPHDLKEQQAKWYENYLANKNS